MTVRILAAATLYFLIVFGVGFLLGPIRVFWLEPRIGPLAAVACETPFLLAATVIAARAAPRVARRVPSGLRWSSSPCLRSRPFGASWGRERVLRPR